MSDSEAVVRRMRHIWCCKGAEFARPELEAGWVEIWRLRKTLVRYQEVQEKFIRTIEEKNERIEELESSTAWETHLDLKRRLAWLNERIEGLEKPTRNVLETYLGDNEEPPQLLHDLAVIVTSRMEERIEELDRIIKEYCLEEKTGEYLLKRIEELEEQGRLREIDFAAGGG